MLTRLWKFRKEHFKVFSRIKIIHLISLEVFIDIYIDLGDYRNVTINIVSNLLTRFEESVFKQMLSQMVGTTDGKLLVDESKHNMTDFFYMICILIDVYIT